MEDDSDRFEYEVTRESASDEYFDGILHCLEELKKKFEEPTFSQIN